MKPAYLPFHLAAVGIEDSYLAAWKYYSALTLALAAREGVTVDMSVDLRYVLPVYVTPSAALCVAVRTANQLRPTYA